MNFHGYLKKQTHSPTSCLLRPGDLPMFCFLFFLAHLELEKLEMNGNETAFKGLSFVVAPVQNLLKRVQQVVRKRNLNTYLQEVGCGRRQNPRP